MRRMLPHCIVVAAAICASLLLPAPEPPAEPSFAARETGVRLLGATRGYATTVLWLRSADAYSRGDLFETLATYQIIAELQPRNPAVYTYMAWNQAYNIPPQFDDSGQRAMWVTRGYRTLLEGQRRIPQDASLLMDEWSFVLNRGGGYPLVVLEHALSKYADTDPVWAVHVRHALELESRLSPVQAQALDWFLREFGLPFEIFFLADELMGLPPDDRDRLLDPAFEELPHSEQGQLGLLFHEYDREMLRVFMALGTELHGLMAICHWCRVHLLTLVLRPALELWPRPPNLELALLNSYVRAWKDMMPGYHEEFRNAYQEGVAVAWLAGIENAHQRGGDRSVERFLEHVRENFIDVPELLSGVQDNAS